MSWSGPLVVPEGARYTRSVCLKLPLPCEEDGDSALFGEVLVAGGGADVPPLVTSDVKALKAHAAAVLAAVEWLEQRGRRG